MAKRKSSTTNKSSISSNSSTIHAPTGARFTPKAPRVHSSITHLKPYRVPKGIRHLKKFN